MLLYDDEYNRELEINGKWTDSILYLYKIWVIEKENVSLFLKFSVNIWYTLTLDGPELSLEKKECDMLEGMLCNCLESFKTYYYNDVNCQWLFGYMMKVRTDLFLNSGLSYSFIEEESIFLIEKAAHTGNIFAKLLFALEYGSEKEILRRRGYVREHILKYFDNSQEVDRYFVEILTSTGK